MTRRPPPPQEVIPFLDEIAGMLAAAVLRDLAETTVAPSPEPKPFTSPPLATLRKRTTT